MTTIMQHTCLSESLNLAGPPATPGLPTPHRSSAWDLLPQAARLHHAGHVARGALRGGRRAVGHVAALVRVAPVDGRRQRGRVGGPHVVGHQRVGRVRADLVELDQCGGQHAQQRCAARARPERLALPYPNLDQRGGQHALQRCAAPPRPRVRPGTLGLHYTSGSTTATLRAARTASLPGPTPGSHAGVSRCRSVQQATALLTIRNKKPCGA